MVAFCKGTPMSHKKAIGLLEDTLTSLKDFQLATVKSILKSYQQAEHSQRVLVADEVGLGKTIVAKGVIAELLIKRLQEAGSHQLARPLRVTYICSNQTLARENRVKLAVFKGVDQQYVQEPTYGRLITTAMVNVGRTDDPNKLLEVCSLTPSTSFNLTQGDGDWSERLILLCALLTQPQLVNYEENLRRFWQGGIQDQKDWDQRHDDYKKNKQLEPNISSAFHRLLQERISEKDVLHCDIDGNANWVEVLVGIFEGNLEPTYPRRIRACLRVLMARACSENISADLFILDEFQRFKGLLNTESESEESIVAQQVFSSKQDKNSKVLLLSATPFKAYSQSHDDENGDAHANELNYLLNFISKSNKELLDQYQGHREVMQCQILSLKDDKTNLNELDHSHKLAIELCLQPLICRTERSQVSDGYEAVFTTIKGVCNHSFSVKDIHAFKAMDTVGTALQEISKGHYRGQLMEFYKATPWALSFLSGYQFKKQLDHHGQDPIVRKALRGSSAAWLSRKAISDYSLKLSDAPHAKIKALTERLFSTKNEQLLWVPPSLTHYSLQGCFKGQERFSKTLLFSSWAVVPRALSGLISYEAERRLAVQTRKAERDYYRTHSPRIKFDQSGSLSGWSLIYPAQTLIKFDLNYVEKSKQQSLESILKAQCQYFTEQLKTLAVFADTEGRSSGDRWYALAPMLLDRENGFDGVLKTWLEKLPNEGSVHSDRAQGVEIIRYLDMGHDLKLGPMPADLPEYLAYLSVAGPAVCIARSWKRLWPEAGEQNILQASTKAAIAAVSLFNRAESEAILHALYGKRKYFSAVARYCAEGDFQAVVDEYGHMLAELGIDIATNKLASVLGFSPTRINCQFEEDKLKVSSKTSANKKQTARHSLRCHYAVPLGNQALTNEDGLSRISDVRDAFNSPFRPFMLNSTSIGQEGLDFHWYCRQIVHWNLPSNPIDIEQREGRVNRYKSLVVRNRIAQAYGHQTLTASSDPWGELFKTADSETKIGRQSDLVPYWHYPDGDSTIERYVPMMPMSKEVAKLENALKVLVHYRLAFGQPRQEELLNNVLHREFNDEQINLIKEALVINLSPLMYQANETIS